MQIEQSPTLSKYKNAMGQCLKLYYPNMSNTDISNLIDYSINKRYKSHNAVLKNSYTHKEVESTLLQISDYIAKREPIITAYGTLFKHHADEPNPLAHVVNSFLELRGIHKKQMFTFPKGSEMFERYNLMQQLDKIDANGIYG